MDRTELPKAQVQETGYSNIILPIEFFGRGGMPLGDSLHSIAASMEQVIAETSADTQDPFTIEGAKAFKKTIQPILDWNSGIKKSYSNDEYYIAYKAMFEKVRDIIQVQNKQDPESFRTRQILDDDMKMGLSLIEAANTRTKKLPERFFDDDAQRHVDIHALQKIYDYMIHLLSHSLRYDRDETVRSRAKDYLQTLKPLAWDFNRDLSIESRPKYSKHDEHIAKITLLELISRVAAGNGRAQLAAEVQIYLDREYGNLH